MLLNRAVYARVFSVLCMFLMQAVLARVLSGHDFGIVQMVLSMSFLFAYVATLGIPFFMLKALPMESLRKDSEVSQMLFQSLKLSAWSALCAAAIILAVKHITEGFLPSMLAVDERDLLLICAYGVLFSLNYAVSEVCRGFGRVVLANFVIGFGIMGPAAAALSIFVLRREVVPLTWALGALVFGSILTLLISMFRLRDQLKKSIRGEWKSRKLILKESLPFFLNLLLVYSFSQMDLWAVFVLADPTKTGLYSQAVKLVQVFSIYQTAILATVPSQVVPAFHGGDWKAVRKINRRIGYTSASLAAIPCLLYLTFGEQILNLIFRTGFPDQIWVLAILASGFVLNLIFGPQSFILSLSGKIHQVNALHFMAIVIFLGAMLSNPGANMIYVAATTVLIGLGLQFVMRWILNRAS